jgi:hypothetical protein
MDEYTEGAFANRDEPLPLVAVPPSDRDASSSEADATSRRQKIKNSLSPLKSMGKDFLTAQLEKNAPSPGGRLSLQDRLFSKYDSHASSCLDRNIDLHLGFSSK